MINDVLEVVRTATEPCLTILVQQLEHDVHELITVVDLVLALVWEDDARLSNLEEQQATLLIVEGRHADQHLVDEDAKGPPIHGEIVPCLRHHLWG